MEKENQTNNTFNEPVSMELTKNNRFIIAIQPQGDATPFIPDWTVKSFQTSNYGKLINIKILETAADPVERKICQAIDDKTRFNITKQLLDPCGCVISTTVYKDATMRGYEEDELNYTNDAAHSYTIEIHYEKKAFPDTIENPHPEQLPGAEFPSLLERKTRQIIDTIENTKAKDLTIKTISAWYFTRDVWGGWFSKFAVAENPDETILVRFLDETGPDKDTYRMNQDYITEHCLTYKPNACVEFCLQPDDAFHYTDAKIDGHRFVRIELPANDTQRVISTFKDILMYGIPPFPCGCGFGLM